MNEQPSILLDVTERVATISLNRPPRNTMTLPLMEGFLDRLEEVRRNPDVRALVITSVEGHFCAGAELGTLPGKDPGAGGPQGVAERLRALYEPFLKVLELPIPTVAAVRGAAVGGGFGLALACDLRVVTPRSQFKAPFARLGLHPGMALTHTLPVLIGMPRAMELLLLGRSVRGEEAERWGMANRCVPEEELEATAQGLARELALASPFVAKWTKKWVQRGAGLDPRRAADTEALAQALTAMSADAAEGLQAFFDKRDPVFKNE